MNDTDTTDKLASKLLLFFIAGYTTHWDCMFDACKNIKKTHIQSNFKRLLSYRI